MSELASAVWPSGVPERLADISQLRPDGRAFPFMEISFGDGFLPAFAIGALVILFFGYTRYDKATYGKVVETNRVLKATAPTHLREAGVARTGYLLYAGLLLFVYSALTFFGEFIFLATNSLPLAGVNVNTSGFNFDTPTWPLSLAFGFAGFAPLIPAVARAEEWLRAQVHGWIGVPIRLQEHTQKFANALDFSKLPIPKSAERNASDAPKWLAKYVAPYDRVDRLLQTRIRLFHLLDWVQMEQPPWPHPRFDAELNPQRELLAAEARQTLSRFEALWNETVPGDVIKPRSVRLSKSLLQSAFGLAEDQKPYTSGDGSEQPEADAEEDEPGQTLSDLHAEYDEVDAQMKRLCEELTTLFVLSAERDREFHDQARFPLEENLRHRGVKSVYPPVKEPLRTLMRTARRVFREEDRESPVLGLLICLPIVFGIYATAMSFQIHSLSSTLPLSAQTVLGSAALDTLRLAAIFLFPALAVFYWRFRRKDTERWLLMSLSTRLITGVMIGFVVSLVGMGLYALLSVALISTTPEAFNRLLFDTQSGRIAMFWLRLSGAFVSVPFILLVLWSAEVRASGEKGFWVKLGWPVILGMLAIVLVLVAQCGVNLAWFGHCPFCKIGENGALVLTQPDFSARWVWSFLNLIDYILYPAIAFLSCTFLLALSIPKERRAFVEAKPAGSTARPATSAAHVTSAFAVLGLVASGSVLGKQAFAQESQPSLNDETIIVGFRQDAPPFSSKAPVGSLEEYEGYIARLCYSLFMGGDYRVVPVPLTAEDRFLRLRGAQTAPLPSNGEVLAPEARLAQVERTQEAHQRAQREFRSAQAAYRPEQATDQLGEAARQLTLAETERDWIARETWLALDEAKQAASKKYLQVDIVCDPVTLNFNRTDGRDAGIFSPIVFASGVGFMRRRPDLTGFGPIVLAYVRNTTAAEVAVEICRLDHFRARPAAENCNDTAFQARGLTDLENKCEALKGQNVQQMPYVFCAVDSHQTLIEWLCKERESDNVDRVYIGDRDIIVSKRARRAAGCQGDIVPSTRTYTYEPYALIVTKTEPELVQYVQRGVYEFFSDRNRAISFFAAEFTDKKMSSALAYLFLINAVSASD